LQRHINDGREAVNYSRWDLFAGTEHGEKSGEELAKGEMPPADYKMIDGHAQLTKAQSDAVIVWFDGVTGRVATESGTRAAEVKGEQEKH